MSYSLDFRQRVMSYKDKKELTFQQTSDHFDVGIRTLFRWKNCIEPCLTRDKPATKIDMDKLAEDIKNHPDDYLAERAARFKVSSSGIGYALKRLKISYKKNTSASKSRRKSAN